ncbi:MAG: hypothetical protein AVDCRST_MAG13-2649, partial [uncultured Solirubrobacteraceae bacterium]
AILHPRLATHLGQPGGEHDPHAPDHVARHGEREVARQVAV